MCIFLKITGKQKGSVKVKHLSENTAEKFALTGKKKSNKQRLKKTEQNKKKPKHQGNNIFY